MVAPKTKGTGHVPAHDCSRFTLLVLALGCCAQILEVEELEVIGLLRLGKLGAGKLLASQPCASPVPTRLMCKVHIQSEHIVSESAQQMVISIIFIMIGF